MAVGEGIASDLDYAGKPRETPPNRSALYTRWSEVVPLEQDVFMWLDEEGLLATPIPEINRVLRSGHR